MICPKCKREIHIRKGRGRKIHGVWRHKVCSAPKPAHKKPAA